MMERHGGTFLNVLVRGEEEVEAFQPATGARIFNEFCDLICGTEEGLKRCSTCRYLIACACHEKLSRYCCHGGISVLAAPVRRQTGKGEGFLIVTSGPFRRGDGSDRWKDVLEHVRGLPVSRRPDETTAPSQSWPWPRPCV